MEALTPGHLALILLAFILMFGYKKLPDAARSLGRSLRIFKSEMGELGGSEAAPPTPPSPPPASGERPDVPPRSATELDALSTAPEN